jgi:predicted MFS family arabinose efflux permease
VVDVSHKSASARDTPRVLNGNRVSSLVAGLWPLAAAAVAIAYLRISLTPVEEVMRSALSLTDNHIAILQGPALALPIVFLGPLIGFVIDRFERRRLLLVFSVIAVAGSIGTAIASNYLWLACARSIVGLAAPAAFATIFSMVGDRYQPDQRGRASTIIVIAQYIGVSAAFGFGGLVTGFEGDSHDAWRFDLLIMIAPAIAMLLMPIALSATPRSTLEDRMPERGFLIPFSVMPLVLTLTAGLVLGDLGVFAVLSWAEPVLIRQFGTAPREVGTVLSLATLFSGFCGPIAGGLLTDRLQRVGGSKLVVLGLAGLAAAGVPFGFFSFMPNVWLSAIFLALFSTLGGAILSAGIALFTLAIPANVRGQSISISYSIQNLLGLGLAPLAISTLSGALGGYAKLGLAMCIVCVTASLGAAAVFIFGSRLFPNNNSPRLD